MKLIACFSLTGVGGFTAKKLGLTLPDSVVPIAVATLIGAGVIFAVEQYIQKRELRDETTWPVVFAVASAQLVAAIFPGTSRSGAAVFAGLLLGLARPSAVRFAFLVGIPTMFAAGALQLKGAIEAGQWAELVAWDSLIAFVVASVTAWATVVWLLGYVRRRTFVGFAWYRLALGAVLLLYSGNT
jgi:undecaprenyl-diphosphatase